MSREFSSWLDAYVKYAAVTEAPKRMHFWSGVSAIAGALRRKVWIDMARFQWLCNMYIVFVAPPGVVSKSTTTDIAMDLLKQVPGIKFGPDVVTWPALVSAFAASSESFIYEDEWHTMSPLTLVASEMGSLINPQDREMVNLYITLWDGRKTFEKVTKMSGNDTVEAPWINEHDVRNVDWHCLINDLARATSLCCFSVTLRNVHTFHHHHVLIRYCASDSARCATVLPCNHNYFVSFLDFHIGYTTSGASEPIFW
jgi:hypothetical protein